MGSAWDFAVECTGVPRGDGGGSGCAGSPGSATILGVAPEVRKLRTNAFSLLEGRT